MRLGEDVVVMLLGAGWASLMVASSARIVVQIQGLTAWNYTQAAARGGASALCRLALSPIRLVVACR